MSARSHLLWLALLALAVALRLGVMLQWPEQLMQDRDLYLGIASEMRSGHGYATPGSEPPRATAFRPPLYPLLLTITGGQAWAIGLLHLGLAVAMVISTGLAADRFAGQQRLHSVIPRFIAGGIVAIDPMLLLYSGQPMTETLCSCLTGVLLWVIAGHGPSKDEPPQLETGRAVAIGLLWGLCLLARPTYAVPLGLWIVGSLSETRQRLRLGLVAVVVALAVLAPWGARNWLTLGQPILTTTHGGYTLWLANNPVYYDEVIEGTDPAWRGESLDRWQKETDAEMDRRGISGEIPRDQWLNRHAREFISSHPWRFVRACCFRCRTFWSIWPGHSAETMVPVPIVWGIAGGYAALWVGGVLAILRAIRGQQWQFLTSTLCLILGFTVVHLVYWTDARMRAPIIPALAILIAVGLSSRADSPGPRTDEPSS